MNRTHLSILAALLTFALPALAQNTPPVVTNQIADFTEYAGAPQRSIDLTTAFADSDVSAAVRLTTVSGKIDIALFGQQKPITVANFLNYVDQGRYFKIDPTNGQLASSFVHRSIPGFIIQGGGYIGTVDPAHPANAQPTQVLPFSRDPKRAWDFKQARHNRDGAIRHRCQQRDEPVVHQSRGQRWPAQQSRYSKRRLHRLRPGREQRHDGR